MAKTTEQFEEMWDSIYTRLKFANTTEKYNMKRTLKNSMTDQTKCNNTACKLLNLCDELIQSRKREDIIGKLREELKEHERTIYNYEITMKNQKKEIEKLKKYQDKYKDTFEERNKLAQLCQKLNDKCKAEINGYRGFHCLRGEDTGWYKLKKLNGWYSGSGSDSEDSEDSETKEFNEEIEGREQMVIKELEARCESYENKFQKAMGYFKEERMGHLEQQRRNAVLQQKLEQELEKQSM